MLPHEKLAHSAATDDEFKDQAVARAPTLAARARLIHMTNQNL